jgi:hypothetical protein
MSFIYEKKPDQTEIYMGVLDEEVLCGKKDEANAWDDAHGRHVPRIGGLGKDICYTERHIFLDDAIPGVTDDLPGKKWLTDTDGGEPFEGKPTDCKKV